MLDYSNLTSEELAERLQEALIQEPPQEFCMVLDNNQLRFLTPEEDAAMGSRLVLGDIEGPNEIPMNIPGHPGWKLVLEG